MNRRLLKGQNYRINPPAESRHNGRHAGRKHEPGTPGGVGLLAPALKLGLPEGMAANQLLLRQGIII